MVQINTVCRNISTKPGYYGGARCICPKCRGIKEEKFEPLEIVEGTIEDFIKVAKNKRK